MVNRGAPWPREKAIALWRAGKSGSQIAEALDLTRSTVMGYLSRQGIVGDSKKTARPKTQQPKKAPEKKDKPPAKPRAKPKAAPAPPPPADIPVNNSVETNQEFPAKEYDRKNGYGLLELEKGQCRFPISGHDVNKDAHVFCGAACGFGQKYCKNHLKKMRPQK